jgi:hypothetical protein
MQRNRHSTVENPVVHRGAWCGYPEKQHCGVKHAIKLGCTGSVYRLMTADDSLIRITIRNIKTSSKNLPTTNWLNSNLKWRELPTLREYLTAGMMNNSTTRLVLEQTIG